jgi:alpha-glucosidase (family GH31 glycosyl hydrolase)
LKENHLTEIKKINSIKEETKTMQNDSRPSEVVSAELQTLKKNYDELKLEVEQSQQAVWKTIKTDANSMEQNRSQILVLKEDY